MILCTFDAGTPLCGLGLNDPTNCGGCGITCPGGQTCGYGACRDALNSRPTCYTESDGGCGAGTTFCPNDAGSCACPYTSSDPNNCGGCGIVCGPGSICNAGSCAPACPSGEVEDLSLLSQAPSCLPAAVASAATSVSAVLFTISNTVCPAAGASTSPYLATLDLDDNNCGSCGNVCPQGQSCLSGSCGVPCGGSVQCIASGLRTDGGVGCPPGSSACGSAFCGCSDFQTDSRNCGACGSACAPGQTCENGACVTSCPSGQLCAAPLGDGEGYCVASCPTFLGVQLTACGAATSSPYCALTDNDQNNCGSCGNVCPNGLSCHDGVCQTSCYCEANDCVSSMGASPACASGQVCDTFYGACSSTCP